MSEPENKWTVTVVEDPVTGDLILPFPPDMLASLDWQIGDTLNWDVSESGQITLSKKA